MTTKRYSIPKRIIAMVLSIVMVLSVLPVMSATAVQVSDKKADSSTMDSWKQYFALDDMSTEHAGGIWTDKSVFTDATAFPSGVTLNDANSFLVALSALGSNSIVMGESATPTDTVFVLDISGSMENSELNAMVTAANDSIRTLMTSNEENRVGIVLYSDDAHVLLPLDRYTGVEDEDGNLQYITRRNNRIRTVSGLLKNGQRYSNSVEEEGGTYIQSGLYLAWEEFSAATVDAADKRVPVIVLMSDGAPTFVTNDYNAVPDTYEYGQGSSTTDGDAFVTQLTAAYVKAQVAKKYGTNAYFYTLGLGVNNVTDSDKAIAVLNTSDDTQTDGINDYWDDFNAAANGASIDVVLGRRGGFGGGSTTTQSVTVISELQDQRKYVDKYFAANDASQLVSSFQSILNEISLQTGYYPTRLDDNAPNYGGYITFVDEIGMGMEVTHIKGILVGDTLYTGVNLAKALYDNSFGTVEEPTPLGDNMVWALKERLGLTDTTEARELLNAAYEAGQLHYTSDSDWSSWIGWYGDADGNYLGFWDSSDANAAVPEGAEYYNMSYGMLGTTTDAQTTHASDMMYIAVMVSTEIATGHQTVTFRIPAALLPVVTAEIHLEGSTDPDNATITIENNADSVNPIRLVYEVGIRDDLNSLTIKDILPDDYQPNEDGTYTLYTNHWTSDPSDHTNPGDSYLNDTLLNELTYSHYEPSTENEHYYFTEDTPVLDADGNPVTKIEAGTTYYYRHRIFSIDSNGEGTVSYHLETISAEVISHALTDENGYLYIEKGTMRLVHTHDTLKDVNTTETFRYSYRQVPKGTADQAGEDHVLVVVYHGNNGMITYAPEQGIKLSKALAEGVTADGYFTFTITLTPNGNEIANTYETITVHADGSQTEGTVTVSGDQIHVSLKAGETIYILGIPAGVGYTIVEDEIDGYRVDTINGETVSSANGIIEAHEFSAVTFTNTIQEYSYLTVAKTVTYEAGTSVDAAGGKAFPVTVTFLKNGKAWAGKTVSVDGVDVTTDANGSVTFNIKDAQTVTITNLPVGVTYTVTEGTLPDGYTWTNPNDHSLSGQIDDNGAAAVLTNTYTPEEVRLTDEEPSVSVTVNKTLQTPAGAAITDWSEENFSFTFNLERWDGSNWNLVNSKKLTQAGNISFNLAGQVFEAVGEYYFRVSEVVSDRTGMTYDRTLHIFQVTVTDTLSGALTISNVTSIQHAVVTKDVERDAWTVTTSFVNTYEPNSTKLALEGIKTLNGRDLVAGEFSFNLYEADANFAYTESDLIETTGNGLLGDIIFAPITYTEEGTYYYVVNEVQGNAGGVTYTDASYKIAVTVEDVEGHLTVTSIVVNGETVSQANLKAAVSFTNEYDAADVAIDIPGTKILNGRDLADGEFTFVLRDIYGNEIARATNAGSAFVFEDISFTQTGTYTYLITEVAGHLGGVDYDDKAHVVVITVTDNGQGQLVATYTVDGVTNGPISFTNTYTATQKTPVVLSGTKNLVGRDLINGEFSFVLKDKDGNVVQTVSNVGNGFTFEGLTFTSAGTYEYTISEVKGSKGGVTYDGKEYKVTITVTDDGNGNLVAAADIANSSIVFNNSYSTTEAKLALTGHKYLTGRDQKAGEFTFVLKDEDGNVLQTKQNDSNGLITFDEITYSTPGSYTYTIEEVLPEGAADRYYNGVDFDPVTYTVTVTVVDNGDGQLIATVKTVDSSGVETDVQFFNKYQAAPASVTLGGSKTLTGRDLEAGEFSFQLVGPDGEIIETVTNGADGKFSFKELTFNEVGTYIYTISEAAGSLGGVSYDSRTYTVTIVVTDNGLGQLVTRINNVDASVYSDAVFSNSYDTADATITLSGTKTLNGRDIVDGEFSFVLSGPDGYTETVTSDADGKFTFPELTFTAAGVYNYTITEVKGDKGGVTYDSKVYNVVVTVTDDLSGNLVATYSIDGVENASIGFTNEYKTDPTTIILGGSKELTGRLPVTGEFQFTLTGPDGYTETVKNTTNSFVFSELTFTAAGEYRYTIEEEKLDMGGMSYDTTVYDVVVTVVDNGDGTLTATAAYYVNGERVEKAVFSNTYTVEKTSVELSGTKELTGRDLRDGEFTFELWEKSDYGVEGKQPLQTTTNSLSGLFTFEPIDFTTAGDYSFIIVETKGSVGGVTYDTNVFEVVVKVTDDLKGSLHASMTVKDTSDNSVKFVNSYKAGSTTLTLEGAKSLTGRGINDGEFSFQLIDSNGTVLQTVTNDGNSFRFDALTFDEAGEFIYTIVEVKGDKGGVTYDTTQRKVIVTVTDDGNGHLKATYVVEGTTDNTISFTNSYKANGTSVILEGLKVLEGRDLRDGEFSFELWLKSDYENNTGAALQTKQNDSDGEIVFDAISYDTACVVQYVIVEKAGTVGGVTYDESVFYVTVTVTDDMLGQLGASVTVNNAADTTVKFVNTYKANSVTINISGSKVLTGRAPVDGEFEFQLKDSSGNTWTARNKDGKFVFEDLTFTEAGDYEFTVSEVKGDKGGVTYDETTFKVIVKVTDDGNGQLAATYEVVGAADNTITFTNSYSADSTSVTLKGTKTLDGRDQNAGEFKFELWDLDDYNNGTGSALQTVTNGADGSFAFGTITYTETGTYKYVIVEVDTDVNGVTYDTTRYYVVVVVSDDSNGHLTRSITINEKDSDGSVSFANTYKAAPITVDLGGKKVLSGRDIVDGEFSFILKDASGNEVETVTNTGGTFKFSTLTFDAAGEYKYTISEIKGDKGGVTYDSRVYDVVITVTDDLSGNLVAAYTIGGVASGSADFANTYVAVQEIPVVLEGSKTLTGREMKNGEFSFVLKDSEGKVVETVTNQDGKFSFTGLTFDAAGEYKYTISEVIPEGDQAGVTYDAKVYDVVINVTDDLNGELVASYTVDGTANGTANFENKYAASETKLGLSGMKELEGRDLNEGEFFFTLLDANKEVIETVSNAADGTITFRDIVFTEVGEYTYYVVEDATNALGGVTYDENIYTVVITVIDNQEGELVASAKTVNSEDEEAEIRFYNMYQAAPVDVTLGGNKTLDGRDMADGEFSFQLTDAEGNVVEVVTNKDGKFTFTALTFDKIGEYVYTISELAGEAGGVVYDEAVYTVVITVTDDLNGNLVSTCTVNGVENGAIGFVNTYTAEQKTPVVIEGSKVLEGRDMVDGEFSFVLKDGDGNVIETVTNKDGKFVFAGLTFEEAGTFLYTVSEVSGNDDTVTYDKTVFEVVVTVTDDAQGELHATCTVESEEGTIEFVNTYHKDEDTPPKTSDEMDLSLVIGVMLVSAMGLFVVMILNKRRLF